MAPKKKAEKLKEDIPKMEKPKAEFGVFDFVNAINLSKINLIRQSDNPEATEKLYVPYLTNRALSYFMDTILYANEVNMMGHVDKLLQFEYCLNSIRKGKRFSKWHKAEKSELVDAVSACYNVSAAKAKEIIKVLTPEQLAFIQERQQKGGV